MSTGTKLGGRYRSQVQVSCWVQIAVPIPTPMAVPMGVPMGLPLPMQYTIQKYIPMQQENTITVKII